MALASSWSFAVPGCAELPARWEQEGKEELRGWFDPYLAVPELFLTKQHKPEWVNMEQLGNIFFLGVVTHCNLPKVT